MNNLVSRNPIQRFKEGKKIIKAGGGTQFWMGRMGDWYSGTRNGNTYINPTQITPEKIIPQKDGRIIAKINGQWYNQEGQRVVNFGGTRPIQKQSEIQVEQQTQKAVPVIRTEGSSFRTAFNQARNSGLQEFTWNGKRYNTMKAGETKDQWLAGLKEQQVPELPQVIPIAPVPIFTAPKFDQQPVIDNAPKPTYNFDRSQIRNMIRQGGLNPYAYTGAQRKALRLYLNGQSNDTSLLDGTDLARFTLPFRKKQGGQLISRNPIERFKLRK